MTPALSEYAARGEVAVIGLGRSGRAVATLLAQRGARVYASDASSRGEAASGASALAAAGITAEAGRHDLARIARAALVVASPGVPPTAPPLETARAAGVQIVSEVEIALGALPAATIIAITGTNGKTTTTALIAHLLMGLGRDAVAAGNIGTPVASFALRPSPPAWFALELSSFQLHDTPSLKPDVGVLTNLAPDHLDRYAGVDEYYADKALLYRNAAPESKWVWNANDAASRALASGIAGKHVTFSSARDDTDGAYDRARDMLMLFGEPLLPRAELALLGDHNVENALAAALAVTVADLSHAEPDARDAIAHGLRTFRALAHRLELVGEFRGVEWINDSKATNVSSTRVAIAGMRRPTILLLGGRHKGEPYTSLAGEIARHVRVVLAYGEAAPTIVADLKGSVPVERLGSSFEAVMARARALAVPGDAVLLSPACSSYDMFENYEERGAEFRRLASEQ